MTTNNLPAQLGPSAVPLTAPPRPASDLGPAEYGGGLDWPRILNALRRYRGAIVLVTHDEGAVEALQPERIILLPDGVEDSWSEELSDLVALA